MVRGFDSLVPGLALVRPDAGRSAEAVRRAYANRPDVLYAEFDAIIPAVTEAVPNDPRFAEQWPLANTGQNGGTPGADISAVPAWDDTVGSRDVVVAVLDGGVNYKHEDLAANAWVNPGEIAGNRIDDDGNGVVDDVHGADYVSGDGDPLDVSWISHGTHVAGIIGAVGGNGTGVSGVSPQVSLMGIRVVDASNNLLVSNLLAGIDYADRMGARVLNVSLGWTTYYQTIYDAFAAYDGLAVCAAGNNYNRNNDTTPVYPASFDLANVIAVGATDNTDHMASYSNYGPASVDLFAPGSNVLSTVSLWGNVFYDDMSDFSGWDTSRYSVKPWSITSTWYVSPPAAAAHMGYANNESSYIIQTTPVDLAGLDYARLTFDAWRHTQSGGDYLRAYVSRDPVITDDELVFARSGGGAVWYYDYSIDLTPYVGGPVYLAFEMRSNASTVYSGVMVDDVYVLGGASEPAYTTMSGTSMATPHVAGVAALLLAEKPSLTTAELRSLVLAGAEPLPQLAGLCVTGGRLDAMRARDALGDLDPPVTTALGVTAGKNVAPVSVTLSATDDRSGVAWTRYALDGGVEVDGSALTVTAPGAHTLAWRSADASGNVEATKTLSFEVVNRYQETHPALGRFGSWTSLARTQLSGGTAVYTGTALRSVTATFTGTGIDWIGARTTSAGRARVYLDGTLVSTVDLYAPLNQFQQALYTVRGLPEGPHSLRVEVAGARNTKSTGTNVWVDAFDVCGELAEP
ncbi:MAG: hypothetical protein FDZ70_05885 [Actinobacteria bacterium]|nr:MAG: hypothetical protein FDZ70_05885 [Actinomycetota bacterium]